MTAPLAIAATFLRNVDPDDLTATQRTTVRMMSVLAPDLGPAELAGKVSQATGLPEDVITDVLEDPSPSPDWTTTALATWRGIGTAFREGVSACHHPAVVQRAAAFLGATEARTQRYAVEYAATP